LITPSKDGDWDWLSETTLSNTVDEVSQIDADTAVVKKRPLSLLNDAFYATFHCEIKKLLWSDNHRAGSFERP
jgi:hypothetical protein